jgi:hypothetical protein
MWNTVDFMKPWMWHHDWAENKQVQAGWDFACPKCEFSYVLPTEEGYKNTEDAKYPTSRFYKTKWTEQGDLENITLNPSVVCRTKGCEGHYWIRDGKITNC